MLFKPTLEFEIIKDKDFKKEISKIEAVLSDYRTTGAFKSFDGLSLTYEYYLAENSRGNVIIVHGFTEFCRKYYETAYYFLKMGYSVFMYDQRGHGFSEREVSDLHLAHVESYDCYTADLKSFIDDIVTPKSEGKDIFIFSHSLGGAVSVFYLMENHNKIKKAVLSAPLIDAKTHNVPAFAIKRLINKSIASDGWKGKFKYASNFIADYVFEDSDNTSANRLRYYHALRVAEPKYQNSSSTNKWMWETLALKYKLLDKKAVSKIKSELLIMIAGKDKVIKHYSQNRFEKLVPYHQTVRFPNAEHSIYTGSDRDLEIFYNKIFEFFEN